MFFKQAIAALSESGASYCVVGGLADEDLRREWLTERNLMALSYGDPTDPLREVDVLLSPPVDSVPDLVAHARHVAVGSLTVPLISIPDLIQMKRRSDRAQDLADVAHLEQLVARDA